MKDDAIVLRETEAIMHDLPSELQHDDEILNAVIESLQKGVSVISVRQDALEIAQMKLEAKVDKGFELVAGEFQKVRHEAELDRVHAQYAKQSAIEAKQAADQALAKIHEVATVAAVASAKADGATQVAKVASKAGFMGFDPLTGMTICVVGIVGAFLLMTVRIEKAPPQPTLKDALKEFCDTKGNSCNDGRSRPVLPTNGGV